MDKKVLFYEETRPTKLGRSRKLSLMAFNRLYEPDADRLFNPPRGEMPYTYYRNIKSGKKYMVASVSSED